MHESIALQTCDACMGQWRKMQKGKKTNKKQKGRGECHSFHVGLLLPTKAMSTDAGIAPYMALELASYDLMPSDVPAFAKGFTAALFATSICYSLDTVRCVWHLQLDEQFPCVLAARHPAQSTIWEV